MPDLDPPFIPPVGTHRYWDVRLEGGPLDNSRVPFYRRARFGVCIELPYDEPGWGPKRTRTVIYKVCHNVNVAKYVGTLR